MLAMGNGYYWGNFGLPRDHAAALRFYRRAHARHTLQHHGGRGEDGAGEGAPRNTSEALEHYRAAADAGQCGRARGLGVPLLLRRRRRRGGGGTRGPPPTAARRKRRVRSPRVTIRFGVIRKNDITLWSISAAPPRSGLKTCFVNAGVMLRSRPGCSGGCRGGARALRAVRGAAGGAPRVFVPGRVALIEGVRRGGRPAGLRPGGGSPAARSPAVGGWRRCGCRRTSRAGRTKPPGCTTERQRRVAPEASFNAAWLGERDARDAKENAGSRTTAATSTGATVVRRPRRARTTTVLTVHGRIPLRLKG